MKNPYAGWILLGLVAAVILIEGLLNDNSKNIIISIILLIAVYFGISGLKRLKR